MPVNRVRVLFLGDVIGKPGRQLLTSHLKEFKKREEIDICAVNGENAAGGNGITPKIADCIFDAGVDVITTGDHIWDRKEIEDYLNINNNIIRPLNYVKDAPGKGITVIETAGYQKICFINLLGRIFMKPSDSPFAAVDMAIKDIKDVCKTILVDFHAEATSEKRAMGEYLNGKVSAVLGTHTHVPTADASVSPEGTAYITDMGMTGPYDSVIGLNRKEVLLHYRYQFKRRFKIASGDLRMGGVILEIDSSTGKALSIRQIEERFDE